MQTMSVWTGLPSHFAPFVVLGVEVGWLLRKTKTKPTLIYIGNGMRPMEKRGVGTRPREGGRRQGP